MSVDVINRVPELTARINASVPLALRLMLDAIGAAADPTTPKDTGNLRNNKLKQVLGTHATIAWVQKYAGAQEAGYMTVHQQRSIKLANGSWVTLKEGVHYFKRYTTKGTGPHYAAEAVKQVIGGSEAIFRSAGLI